MESRYSDESPDAAPNTGGLQPPPTQAALALEESLFANFGTYDFWDGIVDDSGFLPDNVNNWQTANPTQADAINPDILGFLGIDLPPHGQSQDWFLP